jgi:alkanesulfonate monooxygenase SsuD/methylene tetrahydromethanopterin reductase-like flavin-dependent oxidoreductase (luciferase family)
VSIGLHTVTGSDAGAQAAAMLARAQAAEAAGFHGVTVSEHHGDFATYMGQPLLASNWILGATSRVWAGPCPYLLGLRNPVLVAEELAWSAAAFPGRFGAALAPGYAPSDFDYVNVDLPAKPGARFDELLGILRATLAGEGEAATDPAMMTWGEQPAPLLAAAQSKVAVRRAVRHGLGLFVSSMESRDDIRPLVSEYRELGGQGPVLKNCPLWIGTPPRNTLEDRERVILAQWRDGGVSDPAKFPGYPHGSPEAMVEAINLDIEVLELDCVDLRPNLPGVEHHEILEQIHMIGSEVLPKLAFPVTTA